MLLKHLLNKMKQRRSVAALGYDLRSLFVLNGCWPQRQYHLHCDHVILNIIKEHILLLKRTKCEQNINKNIKMSSRSFEVNVFQPKIRKTTAATLAASPTTTTSTTITIARQIHQQKIDSLFKLNEKPKQDKIQQQQQQQSYTLDYENDSEKKCQIYEDAILALNTLQSNAETLRMSITNNNGQQSTNALIDTEKYLVRSGLTIEDLKQLSYIHVSGTKGKGSTCALTESILRSYGYKTGFFSSPHLISVTERIRINGEPISKVKFAETFWCVYRQLEEQKDYAEDMPSYFKFLTILSFHVLLKENVDVAILEVGIGGELDTTNIIPNTKTVGITSLGLEHTQLLGNTMEEIAWQKAGIIKPKSHVFTAVKQPECLEVIKKRAKEKDAIVYIVPELPLYFPSGIAEIKQQNFNPIIHLNASLAIQLSYDWLRQNNTHQRIAEQSYPINQPILTETALYGLNQCHWPGRCQIVKFQNLNMHLDGAHTTESMTICSQWFAQVTQNSTNPKILLFNTTGNRDSQKLLQILHNLNEFQLVCFMPNVATTPTIEAATTTTTVTTATAVATAAAGATAMPTAITTFASTDSHSILHTHEEQLKRANIHLENWRNLCLETQQSNNNSLVFPSLFNCFKYINDKYSNTMELNILVTGSIHLLGATILSLNEFAKRFYE